MKGQCETNTELFFTYLDFLSKKHQRVSGIFQTEGLFVLIGMKLGDVAAERIAALVRAPAVAAVVDIFSGEMHRLQVILHLEKAPNFPAIFKVFITYRL
jgi:hypothetical protein